MKETDNTQPVLASEIALPMSPGGLRSLYPKPDPFGCVRRLNLRFLSMHIPRVAAPARSTSARGTFAAPVFLADP